MKKDYTKICLNKIINYPCYGVRAYSNELHKTITINFDGYESLKNQCLSLDLVLNHTSFKDDQLNLKFKNCFHIWTSKNRLECSY